jgi:hypothetical protein
MLESLAILLGGLHTIGAALGAGGALYAELFYTKAIADGRIDTHERAWFSTTYFGLAWGMLIVLLSGLALIIVQYFLPDSPQAVLYAPLWMQNTLALVVTFAAWLMSRRSLPWWLGSSLVFAGWWMMLALDAWQGVSVPYLTLLFIYVLAVFGSGFFWSYMRTVLHKKK